MADSLADRSSCCLRQTCIEEAEPSLQLQPEWMLRKGALLGGISCS